MMIKIFCILFLFLIGCNIGSEFEFWSYYFKDNILITNVDDAHSFVYENIQYAEDFNDSWQMPHETIEMGKGDCEDMTLLFMYLIYKHLQLESYLIIMNCGNTQNHILAQLSDGKYYDPMLMIGKNVPLPENSVIIDKFNYGRSIFLATVK